VRASAVDDPRRRRVPLRGIVYFAGDSANVMVPTPSATAHMVRPLLSKIANFPASNDAGADHSCGPHQSVRPGRVAVVLLRPVQLVS